MWKKLRKALEKKAAVFSCLQARKRSAVKNEALNVLGIGLPPGSGQIH
jgi:hypothetical protein